MAVISMAVLHCLFLQRVISHFGDVSWPPHSPDLAEPGFFLWGYLKNKVYSSCPIDLNALKLYEKKSQTFQIKHFGKLYAVSQLV